MLRIRHKSDCSLHNAPAYEPKPCDCGGERAMLVWVEELMRRGEILIEAIENNKRLPILATDFKVGLDVLRQKLIITTIRGMPLNIGLILFLLVQNAT